MKRFKLAAVAIVVGALPFSVGCQSTGGRFAWWKPTFKSRGHAETSAIAESAPKLPSAKFAAGDNSPAPLADTSESPTQSTPPAGSIAAAPAASSSNSVFPSSPPDGAPSATVPNDATPALAVAPQSSPYSLTTSGGSRPTDSGLPATASAPIADVAMDASAASQIGSAGIPATERYGSPAGGTLPPVSAALASSAQGSASASGSGTASGGFDPYSRYSQPPTAASPGSPQGLAASTPAGSGYPTATAGNASVASIELPAAPGGYRPGGTSSYPTTQASAVSIATRPAASEPPSAYPSSRYSTPTAQPDAAPMYR